MYPKQKSPRTESGAANMTKPPQSTLRFLGCSRPRIIEIEGYAIWQSVRPCKGVRRRDALASIIVKRVRAYFSPVAVGTAIVVPSWLDYRPDALPAKMVFTVIADVANHLAPVFIGRRKKNAVTTFF
jgi:hypothetical protein